MLQATTKFKAHKWASLLHSSLFPYQFVAALVRDPGLTDKFVKLQFFEGQDLSPEEQEIVKEPISTILNRAIDSYSRQMVVIACMYMEAIVRDFFRVIFVNKPKTMNDFIGRPESKGLVKINRIIESQSFADLIEGLADDATRNATSGKFEKWLNRLEKITKRDFQMDAKSELIRIYDLRSDIVHEASTVSVSKREVFEIFKTIAGRLIPSLENMCETAGIPYEQFKGPISLDPKAI